MISGPRRMRISLKILARSGPRGADPSPRSGGSWDGATEQQRADGELNASDATINAVAALQPWAPTVGAQCHRAAGTWPRRRAQICALRSNQLALPFRKYQFYHSTASFRAAHASHLPGQGRTC